MSDINPGSDTNPPHWTTPGSSASDAETGGPKAQSPKPGGESLWVRALFMILFAAIAHVLLFIFVASCILQLIVYLVSERPNDELREFMRNVLAYVGVTLAYLGFLQDEKPFPFAPFPRPVREDH